MRLPCSGAGLWGWRRPSLHWGRPLPSHMPAGAAAEPQQPFFGRSGRRLFVEAARKGDGKQRRPKKQEVGCWLWRGGGSGRALCDAADLPVRALQLSLRIGNKGVFTTLRPGAQTCPLGLNRGP